MTTREMLIRARAASVPREKKDTALRTMADALVEDTEPILIENRKDLAGAAGMIPDVMLDRLALTPDRIRSMADALRQVALLPDPCGQILEERTLRSGLRLEKVSVPMGVIAVICESRPNVVSDAAALALKAGSRCVVRCGKEAHASGSAVMRALKKGLERAGVNGDVLFLAEDTSRASAEELMNARGLVDLLIPRGGKGLIRACVERAKVPVLETGTGICHIYADASCDPGMALNVIENAKCSRPSVCNACEVCLVHSGIAESFLPRLRERLDRVELRLDERAARIIPGTPAGENDFDTEFLDYILAIKIVDSVEEAVSHIAAHSTGHSEAILAQDDRAIAYFTGNVDSAAVYVNASTRFTDGGEFGLGCEMGISTQKLHARGPVGLKELCTYRYIITGNGQVR